MTAVSLVCAVGSALLVGAAALAAEPRRAWRLSSAGGSPPAAQERRPRRPGDPPTSSRSLLAAVRSPGPRSASALAGAALVLLVGGSAGWLLGGAVAALLPLLLRRLEPSRVRSERLRLVADLPVAVDLLGACLAAGAAPAAALAVVADAVDGPLSRHLGRVAGALRLGADPSSAWAPLASTTELRPLARAMIRSYDSGAPLAAMLDRMAVDLRAQRRAAAAEAAQAVAVKAVGPLGACFLPAFVLLGVVPTVWGIAATTFGGWG